MKKKLITIQIFLSIIISSFSCGDSESFIPLEGKEYFYSFASTQEECTEILLLGVNCFQSIKFLDRNKVIVVVTDIITPATYCTSGNQIIVTVTENAELFEAENPLVFSISEDLSQLIRVSAGNQVWKDKLPWD